MVASRVTGIGWYGEPFQQGLGVWESQSRTLSMTSLGVMSRTSARRVMTPLPLSFIFISAVRLAETTRRVSLSASGTPRASRIEPRTAGWTTRWTWLLLASW